MLSVMVCERINNAFECWSTPHPKRNFVQPVVATKSKVTVNADYATQELASSISTYQGLSICFRHKSKCEAGVSTVVGYGENAVKSSACWIWRPTGNVIDHTSKDNGSYMFKRFDYGNPQYTLQDQGIFDSGCSMHMTRNKSFLIDYQEVDGGFVAFAGSPKRGKIIRKGKIRTGKLDFEDVYFVKELKFNLFFVLLMCDKKNSVLFNMYSFYLKNVVPSGGLTCLFANAIIDESNLWQRWHGHINFKTMNKLVKGNLVRGLPSKLFENDHTCVAC
ncbi:ribonuclease H-like domain-containing protein [Tanacetum coccineum]